MIVIGLMTIGFVFKLKGKVEVYEVLTSISLALGLIFLIIPALGNLIVKGWFKLAEGLGWINSRILLSIIFFFILFPMSLIRRLTSQDNLLLKKKKRTTTFVERNHTYEKRDMKYGW